MSMMTRVFLRLVWPVFIVALGAGCRKSEAHGRNTDVSETDLDAEMLKIRQDFQTEDAYKHALLLQGVTVEQLRDVTSRSLQARKLVDAEVTTKITVQDADVDAFYNQNID